MMITPFIYSTPMSAEVQPTVIYQDDDYVAVNKPPNYHIDGTKYGDQTVEKYIEKLVHIRPKLIHQLDSATSGVMLLGLNRKAAAKAAKQFERRLTRKYYIAAVEGEIKSKMSID